MSHTHTIGQVRYTFPTLARLLAKASPARSGDDLAGISAASAQERIAAQLALADLPLKTFLSEPIVSYDTDEITRLIYDQHDVQAFAPISHLRPSSPSPSSPTTPTRSPASSTTSTTSRPSPPSPTSPSASSATSCSPTKPRLSSSARSTAPSPPK